MSIPAGMLREHSHETVSKRPREVTPATLDPGAILQLAALAPGSLRPADLLRLQQTVGNRAVGVLLNRPSGQRPIVQAKLMVNDPRDKYEQEADRVADAVMRMPAVPQDELDEEDEEAEIMTKPDIQGSGDGSFEVGEEFEHQLQAGRGQGQPLPPTLRDEFERKFGTDFSRVRIHAGAQSDVLNHSIQAKAFTHRLDIYVGAGQYNPRSPEGKRLLAHELTHVMQQNPVSNTIQRRVGFEIETGIPLTKRVAINRGTHQQPSYSFQDLHPQSIGDNLKYTSKNVKLVADHIHDPVHTRTPTEDFDKWPIIELVTDPIDDNMSLADFKNEARQWIDLLKQIKQKAQRSPPARKLKRHPDYYVGLPSATPYNQWDRIAPQMTAGIPLNRIGKLLTSFTMSGTISKYRAIQLSAMAPTKATLITQALLQVYPSLDASGVQALKGLVTMMCNYLLIGKDVQVATIRYFKNRPATIFPKTKLSTIQQYIVSHPYPSDILLTPPKRAYLKTLLLNSTNRNPQHPLFVAGQDLQGPTNESTVTVGDWIDEVLTGIDDQIFDEMKNPWSREITPDAVDEVIIEYRRLGNFVQTPALRLEDDSLRDYLWKVYAANFLVRSQET